MTRPMTLLFGALSVLLLCAAAPASPTAQEIIARVLDSDPFGLGGANVTAQLTLKDKSGAVSQMAFTGTSVRYDAPFSKSLVRFTAPSDLAGAGFLQIQKREGDDDRFLFLPDLKRSRRIAGALRGNSFMGTDFAFADLDRRDFREGDATRLADESVGSSPCYRVDIVPRRSDSPYSKLEAWVRQDNTLPLKLQMYDRAKVLSKTFTAQEVRRVDGHWFVTKSKMVDHAQQHTTELVISSVTPRQAGSDDEFTVRTLEKM